MATKPTIARYAPGLWDLEIHPDNAPTLADAHEDPEHPEDSNIIGMYGLTNWDSWQEAMDALIAWRRETNPNA